MKKVGFIGACDKTNLIMYVAKALVSMDKKILVIDTTMMQKTRYIVPAINPTKSYIVDFEKIDFAVGFENMIEIARYLGIKEDITANENIEDKMQYDYALINIDSERAIENFNVQNIENNYFVTTFDMYSLHRGIEILSELTNPLKLTKVLYSYDMNKEDEEYLNYISMDCKVMWKDFSIYLPNLDIDTKVIEENQRVYKIRIKRLTPEYQDGIIFIAQDILKENNANKIRKNIKE